VYDGRAREGSRVDPLGVKMTGSGEAHGERGGKGRHTLQRDWG